MDLLIENNKHTTIIKWFWKLKNGIKEIEWASKKDEELGNFSGMAKHTGNVYSVTIMLPRNPKESENLVFNQYEIPVADIMRIAETIKELREREENKLVEID